jgi:DNA-directed RNA polymerase subunit M/transcription elongation factor TFIIS
MADRPLRLGDVIDDYCPRCRLLLNHDIASLSDGQVAKVTCRTCYNTHDYRNAQVPTRRKVTKKDDKKSLMDQVLAGMPPPPAPPAAPPSPVKKRRDLWAEVERLKKK